MDIGRHALVVTDLVTLVAESLKANRPAGGVICASLAAATGADAAVWIALRDGEPAEALWSHPDGAHAEPVIAAVLTARVGPGSEPLTHWRVPRVGEVVALTPTELPGTGPSGARRVLGLAKRKGFSQPELSLLETSLPALTMMLASVMAASERQRRASAQRAAAKSLGLSGRELEVLQLLSQGLLATSIASRLALSPRTVHKHLGNIYEKLGVHDRLVAVELARRHGLVHLPE